ncbi:LAMI_0F15324g1_1 [Lachancea mirantina]|uniref:Elongator complex protein 5 n=1 Tax=Lachancea mirantina TaxID=1230905 RepID=A0A1G4K462_9SACH|nr:LAMI_0F15324g1_1 [Lachancea mirantina]
MASSSHNPSILLRRILTLKEPTAFVLCLDRLEQSANAIGQEFARNNSDAVVIYVSFETLNKPAYVTHFLEANVHNMSKLASNLITYLPAQRDDRKSIVVLDALNYVPNEHLSTFITSIASVPTVVVGTFHRDMPELRSPALENYPSSLTLLQFIATTIFDCRSLPQQHANAEELESELGCFSIPKGLNDPVFKIVLTHRRKSGRALTYQFRYNSDKGDYQYTQSREEEETAEQENMFEGLTTFNLNTSSRQKQAKEQIELPFLEAQRFNTGGAIVYEFEKDDDYEEEDPYEDPF